MKKGLVEVYCGTGKGKSTLALGQSVRECARGKSVIIIQFLKGNESDELEFIEGLKELDLKMFRFEKSKSCYENLNDQEKSEEINNIRNGLNFAKKVIATEECDMLVLDEIFGVVDHGIMAVEDLKRLLEMVDTMHVVLTGDRCPEEIKPVADCITVLESMAPGTEESCK